MKDADTSTCEGRNALRAERADLQAFERPAFDNRWVNHNDAPMPLGLVLYAYETEDSNPNSESTR